MYLCVFCGYSSDKKNNFLRHLKTERHQEIFNKRVDTPDKGYYHCIFCKFKHKKKNNYLSHINLCMMKNLNKSIQIDIKDHISQIQKKFKSEIRYLNSQIKKKTKDNNICLKIIGNLIKENYISERILNDKNVWSSNEKKKIFSYLHDIKDNQKSDLNTKEIILQNIENQVDSNITTIYLDNKTINNFIENNSDNAKSKCSCKNDNSTIDSEMNIESDSESESENDTDSDSEDSDSEDIDKNLDGLKKIRDCGRIFYYDKDNKVYDNENKIIGDRVHDDSCPRNHHNGYNNSKCWWYVEYYK